MGIAYLSGYHRKLIDLKEEVAMAAILSVGSKVRKQYRRRIRKNITKTWIHISHWTIKLCIVKSFPTNNITFMNDKIMAKTLVCALSLVYIFQLAVRILKFDQIAKTLCV